MAHLGIISFQSNDRSDVFLITEVIADSNVWTDDLLIGVEQQEGYEGLAPWETGVRQDMVSVNVEGDTTIINGWYRGPGFSQPFVIRIYVEYEENEEIVKEDAQVGEEQETTLIVP